MCGGECAPLDVGAQELAALAEAERVEALCQIRVALHLECGVSGVGAALTAVPSCRRSPPADGERERSQRAANLVVDVAEEAVQDISVEAVADLDAVPGSAPHARRRGGTCRRRRQGWSSQSQP